MIRAIVAVAASAMLLSTSSSPPTLHLTHREMVALAAIDAKAQLDWRSEAKASTRINHLVKHIHSLKDSQLVVRLVVSDLGKQLPAGLVSRKVEKAVAEAEYRSVSQPNGLIPEQRIADAWNEYLDTIGAPKDQRVSGALIYNLLDADYTRARQLWGPAAARGLQTMPAIYAVGPDGKLRHGATALEAALALHDLGMVPENVKEARNRLKEGILYSDWLAERRKHPQRSTSTVVAVFVEGRRPSPSEVAARRYVREHGEVQYVRVLQALLCQTFPAQPAG